MSITNNTSLISKIIPKICDGRLTVISGTPHVGQVETPLATTLYFSPFDGNTIGLYNTTSTQWDLLNFSEVSLSLTSLTALKNYDIFGYNSSGSLALDYTEWTDDDDRATQLVRQDGVFVKTGELNKRYLGTIRTMDTGGTIHTRDTIASRLVWNYYNRKKIKLNSHIDSNGAYHTQVWRNHLNNSTVRAVNGGRVEFVCGDPVVFDVTGNFQLRMGYYGIAIDSSTPPNNLVFHENAGYSHRGVGGGSRNSISAPVTVNAGYHFCQLCQHGFSKAHFWYAEQTELVEG